MLVEGETVDVRDLPGQVAGNDGYLRPDDAVLSELSFADARKRALETFEKSFLKAALERHGGNVSATARTLGVHRQSLQKTLRRLDISRDA